MKSNSSSVPHGSDLYFPASFCSHDGVFVLLKPGILRIVFLFLSNAISRTRVYTDIRFGPTTNIALVNITFKLVIYYKITSLSRHITCHIIHSSG